MVKYISLGKFNKYYFLIIGSISMKLLKTLIAGIFPSLSPNNPIFLFGFFPRIISHPFIKIALENFGVGIGGLILASIYSKKNKKIGKEFNEENNAQIDIYNKDIRDKLANNSYKEIISKNKELYLKEIFFVFFCYYYGKYTISLLDSFGFHQMKLWPSECITLYFFSKIIFEKKIYKHQIYALLITIIFSTLFYFINSFIPEHNINCEELKDKTDDKYNECIDLNLNIYTYIIDNLHWYIIPIVYLIYLVAITSNSYTYCKYKWFIDIKYISIFRIISYIGMSGFILSFILLFILSFIPCAKGKKFMEDICLFRYGEENSLFYENFRTLKDITINKEFFIEIFVLLPLYIVASFLRFFFDVLIILNLDPFYLLPIENFYFLIYQSIDFFATISITNAFFNIKFFLATMSAIISAISSCIYLEIIELHFCKLDKNLKENIILRSRIDTISCELENVVSDDGDNNNDENNNDENSNDENSNDENNNDKNNNGEDNKENYQNKVEIGNKGYYVYI